jgi:hypothetical protein
MAYPCLVGRMVISTSAGCSIANASMRLRIYPWITGSDVEPASPVRT